jgi:hypothetical protein
MISVPSMFGHDDDDGQDVDNDDNNHVTGPRPFQRFYSVGGMPRPAR